MGVRECSQHSLGPPFFSGTSKMKGCPWDPISESPQPILSCPSLFMCQLSFLSQMSQLLWSIAIFTSEIFLSFSRDSGPLRSPSTALICMLGVWVTRLSPRSQGLET